LAQLAPGPLAAQLAIYLGYVHYGILGATLVGLAFVLPSFLMVLSLGYAYQLYGGLPWMQAVFYGISAGVIGIIAFGSYKLVNKSIGNDKLLWIIFLASALATIITQTENILLFLGAGLLYWVYKFPPKSLGFNSLSLAFLNITILDSTDSVYGKSSYSLVKQGLLFLEVAWQLFLFVCRCGKRLRLAQ
jgi:chromate transporter